MRRSGAFLLLCAALLLLAAPVFAIRPETDTLFDGPVGTGIVADATALDWTVKRLTSTMEIVRQSPDDWEARVLVVISPTTPYASEDAAAAKRFVDEDGILIIADAFEEGNTIAAQFGVVFDRGRLVEANRSIAPTIELSGRDVPLELGTPTGIHVQPDARVEVLSWSSNSTFLDLDGDGVIGSSDPAGPFPLIARVEPDSGDGYALVIADPSLLTSETVNASAFRRALLGTMRGPGLLVVDESHHDISNPVTLLTAAAARAVYLPPTEIIWFALGILFGIVGLIGVKTRAWGPHRFQPEHFVSRTALLDQDGRPLPSHAGESAWTPQGIAGIAGGACLFLLGIRLQNLQAQYAGAFLVLAAATALLVHAPSLRAALSFSTPKMQENITTSCSVELTNESHRRAHFEVRALLPPEMEVGRGTDFFQTVVPGKRTLKHDFDLLPAVRGPFSIGPLEARAQDALHFRTATSIVAPHIDVRVLPAQEQLRTLPFGTRVPMITMGPHLVNRSGEGMEFHSLRDYQLGDSIRIVNWKASARSKDLVVNQRVHETMTHLTIVLDARAVSGAGPADATPIARLSRAVASLAAALLKVRDRIRVFVYTGELIETPHATGSRQLEVLLELLSSIRPAGALPFMAVAEHLAPRIRPKTPILVATCAEADPTLADGLRLLTNIGLLPVLITAPIHADGDPLLSDAEAQARIDEREETLNQVRGAGVPVHELRPGVTLEALFRLGGAA